MGDRREFLEIKVKRLGGCVSFETEIKAAVSSLNYPCAANIYEGTASTYFVFNYSVIPDDYADNEANHERYLVQLHLFAPHTLNTVTTRKAIRNLNPSRVHAPVRNARA